MASVNIPHVSPRVSADRILRNIVAVLMTCVTRSDSNSLECRPRSTPTAGTATAPHRPRSPVSFHGRFKIDKTGGEGVRRAGMITGG